MPDPIEPSLSDVPRAAPPPKPFYASLWVQVLIAMVLAIVLGYFSPARAMAMKPLGDAFIRMITMSSTLLIFCTVVTGLAGMALPLRPLAGECVPEGAFLVDAVIRTAHRPVPVDSRVPWWDMAERLRWTIDLFERMEQRERA